MKHSIFIVLLFTVMISCNKEKNYDPVTACFEYDPTEIVAGEVLFTNCSENATDYHWDFGDGTTSTKKEPKHTYQGDFPFKVQLIAYNEVYADTMIAQVDDDILVKKPNIYIYPTKNIDLCLNIIFPLGGEIVKSIPEYGDGWCVNIDIDGKIDKKYDYLFYESKQPNLFQHDKGWCKNINELEGFFRSNMRSYNFSTKEINDFVDYWIPRLKEHKYYCIYPQTNDIISKTNRLEFSAEPDNVFRLFYSIKGSNRYKNIDTPVVEPAKREGFYVVEWGLMKDKN